eukprot:gene21808-27877_t
MGRASVGSRSSAAGVDVSRISISLMQSILNDDQRSAGLKLSSCLMDSSGALLIGGVQSSVADMEVYGCSSSNTSRVQQSSSLLLSHSKSLAPHREVMFQEQHEQDDLAMHMDEGGGDDDWDGGGGEDDYYDPAEQSEEGQMQVDYQSGAAQQHTPLKGAKRHPVREEEEEELSSRERDIRQLKALLGQPLDDATRRNDSRAIGVRKITKPVELLRAERKSARALKAADNQPLTAKEERQAVTDAAAEVEALSVRLDRLLVGKVENFVSDRRLRSFAKTFVVPMKGLFNLNLMSLLRRQRKIARKQAREAKKLEKMSAAKTKNVSFHQDINSGGGESGADLSRFEELWSRDYDLNDNIAAAGGGGDDWLKELSGGGTAAVSTSDTTNPHHISEGAQQAFDFDDQGGGGGEYDDYNDNNDDYGGGYGEGEEEDEEMRERLELAKRLEDVLNEDLHNHSLNSQGVRPNSYEAICKRHIENFMSGAEQYARETQLSRRVFEWTARLEPLLREQEEAAQFDIHEYSDRLLEDLGHVVAQTNRLSLSPQRADSPTRNEQDVVSFREVAEGRSSSEVCRVFLACLQLANLGNVEVLNPLTEAEDSEVDVVGANGKRSSASLPKATGAPVAKRGKKSARQSDEADTHHSTTSLVSGAMDPRHLFRVRLLRDLRHKSIESFSTQ